MTDSIVNDQYWVTIPDRGLCLIKLDHFYKWVQLMNLRNILFSMVLLPCALWADGTKCLKLELNNKSLLYFALSDKPKITFSNGMISISSGAFSIEQLKKYTIEEVDLSGVHSPASNVFRYELLDNAKRIRLSCQQEKPSVRLYSASGVAVPFTMLKVAKNVWDIDLNDAPKEVLLLQIGTETLISATL